MNLGERIKNVRYNNNISQENMAKILKINRNYLSRMENNKTLPTAEVLMIIAETFNVSIDSLLGINLDGYGGAKVKKSKIDKISKYCNYLSNKDLDFIINLLCVMTSCDRKSNIDTEK